MTTILRNKWYLGAWSSELEDKPLGRRICDEDITFYRKKNGETAAVSSRCPHRFAPMYYGTVSGDNIRCKYHGLAFGPNGKCVENPDGDKVPNLSLKAYPVQEDCGAIWIWIGDGDPTEEIPTIVKDAQIEPYGAFFTGYLHIKSNYIMMMDNLTDHTHAHHLHDLLSAAESLESSKQWVEDNGDNINVVLFQPNEPPAPFFHGLRPFDCNVDRTITSRWHAPSFVIIDADIVEAKDNPQDSIHTRSTHLIVPESENSLHYFWGQARSHKLDDEGLSEKMRQGLQHIFTTEDKWILEGQTDMMRDASFWDCKPALLPQDKGTVMVRRRIEKLISEQQSAATAAE
jgi:vanillate O-demethylase monooxygenase subunit